MVQSTDISAVRLARQIPRLSGVNVLQLLIDLFFLPNDTIPSIGTTSHSYFPAMCLRYLSIAFGLVVQVISQTPSTYFINPPIASNELFFSENVVFSINSQPKIQWVTNLTSYSIFLWQQSLNESFSAQGSSIYSKS